MSGCRGASTTFLGLGLGLSLAACVAASPGGELGEGLRSALEQTGWLVTERADGGVDLRPPAEVPEQSPAAAEVEGASEGAASEEDSAWARLTEHGWRVEHGADGSTLLYPPQAGVGPTSPAAKVAAPDQPALTGPPGEGFDDQLRARGWRVERSGDGSLILYPRPVAAPAARKQAPQRCRGEPPPAVREARIQLPILSWDQARAVAESWLDSVESPGSIVGKIRQIGRIYLVSIVEGRAPHRLRHQIAVDSESGRVLVLN